MNRDEDMPQILTIYTDAVSPCQNADDGRLSTALTYDGNLYRMQDVIQHRKRSGLVNLYTCVAALQKASATCS